MAFSQRARAYTLNPALPCPTLPLSPRALSDSSIIPAAGRLCLKFFTDPPRILEPGKWGSKVRGLAHVQGYRGPKVMHFGTCKFQCQIYQQLQGLAGARCQICQHLQGFLNILFFVLLLAPKSLNCGGDRTLESTMATRCRNGLQKTSRRRRTVHEITCHLQ